MPLDVYASALGESVRLEESGGFFAISSSCIRLIEAGWRDARETLLQRDDLTAVVILQEPDLWTRHFVEAWSALPSRLASLAIRPPVAACLVARANDETRRAVSFASEANRFPLWRTLVELSKKAARIEPRKPSNNARFLDLISSSADEDWLPELLMAPPLHELDWLFAELHLARLSDLCGEVVSPADATAVLSGLWLLHGDGDASHRCSQSIEDEGRHRCGNFWHGIMHRQEPDYGNSKYWFRRVGQHPIFPELARRADELIAADGSDEAHHWRAKLGLPGRWDPFAFVDWCETATHEADARQVRLLRRIQFVEMHLLLRASFTDAVHP